MLRKWLAVIGVVAMLGGCAHRSEQQAREPWNGGVWNSVLGYVGPYNVMEQSPGR